jgi:hypothetical protein
MRRNVTLACCALTALALGPLTGCSSSSKGLGSAIAAPQTATAQTAGSSITVPAANSTTSAAKAATSSSAAHDTSATGVDVCSLLTAAQATSLNNVTYSAATPGSPASYYKTCTYKNTGSPDPVDIQDLTVAVITASGCWSGLQAADGPGKPVSGLGDPAIGTGIGIDVEVGSKCLTISGLTHAELLDNYAPDVAMAKIILAKLS